MATRTQKLGRPTRAVRGSGLAFLRDVVCGVEGTRSSYEAVRQAASLAGAQGRLALLAVIGGVSAAAVRALPASLLVARRGRPHAGGQERIVVVHNAPCSVLVLRPEDLEG